GKTGVGRVANRRGKRQRIQLGSDLSGDQRKRPLFLVLRLTRADRERVGERQRKRVLGPREQRTGGDQIEHNQQQRQTGGGRQAPLPRRGQLLKQSFGQGRQQLRDDLGRGFVQDLQK